MLLCCAALWCEQKKKTAAEGVAKTKDEAKEAKDKSIRITYVGSALPIPLSPFPRPLLLSNTHWLVLMCARSEELMATEKTYLKGLKTVVKW